MEGNLTAHRERKDNGIAFLKPTISKNDIKSVLESIVSDEITFGQTARNYEKGFAETFEFSHAISTISITSAFHLSFIAAEVGPEDEVIMSSAASIAAIDALYQTAAHPVMVDIQKNSFHPAEEDIINKITDKTRCIVLSYPYGSFNDFLNLKNAILDLNKQRKNKIVVIEDVSYLIGSEHNGMYVGTDADIAIAGLHEDMLMTIGKGAIVLTNNRNLYSIMKDRRMHGSSKSYRPRFDYGITDYQAAMGLEQLGHLNAVLERKRKIGERYLEVLRNINGLETFFKSFKIDTYGAFPVISQKPIEHMQKYFSSLQIETARTMWFGPLHQMLGLNSLDFPNATRLYERGILLPVYPNLSRTGVERIMAAIKGYY